MLILWPLHVLEVWISSARLLDQFKLPWQSCEARTCRMSRSAGRANTAPISLQAEQASWGAGENRAREKLPRWNTAEFTQLYLACASRPSSLSAKKSSDTYSRPAMPARR